MNCLVTAGPTFESLDEVRRLTNFSTGTLGTNLANFLADAGHRVTFLLGSASTCHIEPRAQTIETFTTTLDLRQRLLARQGRKTDAVFHAAAVCDYTFGRVFTRSDSKDLQELKSRKYPTRQGNLLAELVPTPKLIARLREWFAEAIIVGWKYEVAGNRKNAIAMAREQIAICRTNACVLNGPAYGHGFGLVTAPRTPVRHLPDSPQLFEALARLLGSRD